MIWHHFKAWIARLELKPAWCCGSTVVTWCQAEPENVTRHFSATVQEQTANQRKTVQVNGNATQFQRSQSCEVVQVDNTQRNLSFRQLGPSEMKTQTTY